MINYAVVPLPCLGKKRKRKETTDIVGGGEFVCVCGMDLVVHVFVVATPTPTPHCKKKRSLPVFETLTLHHQTYFPTETATVHKSTAATWRETFQCDGIQKVSATFEVVVFC